jgi:hypothetical protein
VATTITREAWQGHWSKSKEKTAASFSGCHFGHYIVGMRSDHITYLHALDATLVTKRGIFLDRWSKGLLVMLENLWVLPDYKTLLNIAHGGRL